MSTAASLASAELEARDDEPTEDHIVHIDGATWEDYERLLAIRGERATPRLTYLDGILEIMSPSENHELLKSVIGCLVEVYCLHAGIRFTTVGSWTIKNREAKRGAEPDECYIFGDRRERRDRPHLAIEVIWTSGGLNKLDVARPPTTPSACPIAGAHPGSSESGSSRHDTLRAFSDRRCRRSGRDRQRRRCCTGSRCARGVVPRWRRRVSLV